MPAQEDVLGLIDPGREIRRAPLVGMQFLHQRAMRAADLVLARARPKAQDLIGLLFGHARSSGRGRRAGPASSSPCAASRQPGNRRSRYASRSRSPSTSELRQACGEAARSPPRPWCRAPGPRKAPASTVPVRPPVSWSSTISSSAERTRDCAPGVVWSGSRSRAGRSRASRAATRPPRRARSPCRSALAAAGTQRAERGEAAGLPGALGQHRGVGLRVVLRQPPQQGEGHDPEKQRHERVTSSGRSGARRAAVPFASVSSAARPPPHRSPRSAAARRADPAQ